MYLSLVPPVAAVEFTEGEREGGTGEGGGDRQKLKVQLIELKIG